MFIETSRGSQTEKKTGHKAKKKIKKLGLLAAFFICIIYITVATKNVALLK
jgi:hypothetical protein